MSDRLRKVLHAFSALADLGEELAETSDYEEMVASALHVVLGALGARRGAVAEYDPEAALLRFVAARGTGADDGLHFPPESFAPPAPADAPHANGHADAPLDTSLVEELIGARVRHLPVELVSALVVRGELVGAILIGGKASDEPFTDEDRELVRALGRHVGIGLHNHRLLREVERRAGENRKLYDDLRALYKDTVRAFAAAIDCKDKYTQGHSERVGKYSEIIARELGWADEEVEGIAVAGYLHDIGKLVVDREIINAPYRIDAKQSSQLNRHPATGYEILSPINHPYADIPQAARYHHERVDGRGYPEGLTGDQIPLCAKIVTLADSFDAMTTDRPYKRRRAFEDVVADFRRNTGRQFDPAVVAAFCRALLKEVRGETRPRQIIR
ncbi:MAG TPA: HD domain-containing phosphohydrolase, partial [Pyrinomonadaceae bacterium]